MGNNIIKYFQKDSSWMPSQSLQISNSLRSRCSKATNQSVPVFTYFNYSLKWIKIPESISKIVLNEGLSDVQSETKCHCIQSGEITFLLLSKLARCLNVVTLYLFLCVRCDHNKSKENIHGSLQTR